MSENKILGDNRKNNRHSISSRFSVSHGVSPLKGVLPTVTRKFFKKHDIVSARLLTEWPDIVGKDMARYSCPVSIATSRKGEKTLYMKVISVFALETQHQIPLIIERISVFFGFSAIHNIKIQQVDELASVSAILGSSSGEKNLNNPSREKRKPDNMSCGMDGLEEIKDEGLRKVLISYQKQLLS